MTVETKATAAVRWAFPRVPRTSRYESASDKVVEEITIDDVEKFVFEARMNGAEGPSKIRLESKRTWDGISHERQTVAFVVDVPADLAGKTYVPAELQKSEPEVLTRRSKYSIVQGAVGAGFIIGLVELVRIFG